MRQAGYQAVDLVVRFLENLRELPALEHAGRIELGSLDEAMPAKGRPFVEVLARLDADVLRSMARPVHPRFLAFIPSPGNFIGAVADLIAHGHNVFAGSWLEASGPSMVEVVLLEWLRKLVRMPDSAGGVFQSGGSMANLTALAAARQTRLGEDFADATVYFSDQTHSSVERALRLLGFARKQLRKLDSDDDYRLPLEALKEAVSSDRAAGSRPFSVVANAGTTNTGAVDPLAELAAFCRQHDLWLHVDGAFGAAAVLCEEGRALLEGIEHADSLTLDPHKWLFQPFDCGCLLVRDRRHLLETFTIQPEYLKDVEGSLREPNFWDCGPELTRPFRALKLWMTLQVFGVDAVSAAIQHGFELARVAEAHLRTLPGWRIVTPARMGIVSFRHEPAGRSEEDLNRLNRDIGRRITESGFAVVLSTVLKGQTVLRTCTINPRTTREDVIATLDRLHELAARATASR
ncbi:MAG: aminotransferase class V-fold PLP-dependent enzyme [Acidobacteria bacterium]|nr:aminotransferase class V-fold PLP-dependent enzyme [Acidobacteriota bacterium]